LDSIANELKTIYGQKRKRERRKNRKRDKERIDEEKKET
jgi:hypothetical protein